MIDPKLIKALVFDLDDTLVGSDDFYDLALKKLGIDPAGKPFLNGRAEVKAQLPAGHVCARNRLLYFKAMLEKQEKNGLGALNLMVRYEKELERLTKAQWKRLKRDTLFSGLASRYRLVILTNENLRTQLKKLRAIDPTGKYFERIFTSEEVGEEKPSVKGFKRCLDYLKIPAKNCVSIGNSLEGDILPPLKLGMQGIVTKEFLPSGGRVPAVVSCIDRLQDLSEVLSVHK